MRKLYLCTIKGKGLPQQAELVQGVPGRLRPQMFLTFGTTRVVGRQPYAPAAFAPGETPGTDLFRGWVDPRAHGFVGSYGKNPQWLAPPGIDPETVRLVAQCFNHYAIPGPSYKLSIPNFTKILPVGARADVCWRTDGHDEPNRRFRNFANAPKNHSRNECISYVQYVTLEKTHWPSDANCSCHNQSSLQSTHNERITNVAVNFDRISFELF